MLATVGSLLVGAALVAAVYVFDGTTYTGYNGTTNATGQVTLTLPIGNYRFRADKDGVQYWSGTSNHCTVPGCTAATITVSGQAQAPAGGMASIALSDLSLVLLAPLAVASLGRGKKQRRLAWPVAGALLVVALVGVGAALAVSPAEAFALSPAEGLAAPSSGEARIVHPARLLMPASSPASSVQAAGAITVTRVITTTYDPLNRLTGAEYSTGESFKYAYDAVGNRTATTATTPLSGTLVTTYTYNAANRLTARAVSDGRAYTYTWSVRGQLLAEHALSGVEGYTQGYPVRTFTYNGAGRLVEATVFTLTTRFRYTSASLSAGNGLGDRVAVEVVGQGVTTYTLDLAAGGRILAETTLTNTLLYLYGLDCLGEQRNDKWLYYLPDAEGLVRQGADEQGDVVSAWLFDPDGVVLEGPQGPVSHLVCGGVYDWSTGLIYKGRRYFDPLLGIWLALLPLVVVQSWRGRKKRQRGWPWMVALALFVVGVSGTLAGCGPSEGTPTPEILCTEIAPQRCEVEKVDIFDPPPVGGIPDSGSDAGMQTFRKEMRITFWLKPGVDAQRDCVVGSWVKGQGYVRWEEDGRQHEEPVYPAHNATDWYYDFPFSDLGPGEGVNYNGDHIAFYDTPGKTGLKSGQTCDMNLRFMTVLYDK